MQNSNELNNKNNIDTQKLAVIDATCNIYWNRVFTVRRVFGSLDVSFMSKSKYNKVQNDVYNDVACAADEIMLPAGMKVEQITTMVVHWWFYF